jgi:hypothetical protein
MVTVRGDQAQLPTPLFEEPRDNEAVGSLQFPELTFAKIVGIVPVGSCIPAQIHTEGADARH